MRHAIHAVWTKLHTLPGTMPLLVAVVVGTVGLSAATDTCPPGACGADIPRLSLIGVQLGQAIVAIFAILAIGDEYASGMITVTLAAMPGRLRVLGATTTVVTGLVAVASTLAVAGCLIVGRFMLPAHAFALRPAIGSILYLVLIGLLSLGVATALRHPAASMAVVLTLLYAMPILAAAVADRAWHKHLLQGGPSSAGLAVQVTTGDAIIDPWKGLGVLALWALGAMLAGAAVFRFRDA